MTNPFEPSTTPESASKLPSPQNNGGVEEAATGLGLTTLSALVVANMIGAGVFTSSGFAMAALGNPGRVILAWIICGAWAVCGAIAYGGLVSRLPRSGGEYLFLSRFVHPSVGFLAGWISVFAGFTAPISAAALGAAIYTLPGLDESAWQIKLIATVLIVLATLCHLWGLSLGTLVQNSIVGMKLVLIAITIAWAFLFTNTEAWVGAALPGKDANWLPSGFQDWSVFVGSMSWIALSYTGFNAAIYVAGESKESVRQVPKAMLLATLLVTAIYWLLNIVYVFAPPASSIEGQPAVASIASEYIGGQPLAVLVRVTIVLSMTSSVFAMLLAGPRVYQTMAEDGVMPKFFKGRIGAPVAATVVQAALSVVALYISNLLQLMKYLGLTLSACGALAVLSLWWVRKRIPDAKPLRWWEVTALSVYLGITGCILAASWNEHFVEFQAMLYTFVVGALAYGAWALWEKRRGS